MATQQPGNNQSLEKYIPEPQSIEDTELSMGFLADLVLKLIYYRSDATSAEIGVIVPRPRNCMTISSGVPCASASSRAITSARNRL